MGPSPPYYQHVYQPTQPSPKKIFKDIISCIKRIQIDLFHQLHELFMYLIVFTNNSGSTTILHRSAKMVNLSMKHCFISLEKEKRKKAWPGYYLAWVQPYSTSKKEKVQRPLITQPCSIKHFYMNEFGSNDQIFIYIISPVVERQKKKIFSYL